MSWKTLSFEDCLEKIKTPPKLQKSKYLSEGKFPVIAQEDSIINGYTNDENLVFKINSPLIIFGDHTRKLKYIDFDFVLGADGAKIIKPKSDINVKFFFYYLNQVMPKNIGYARHYKLLKKIKFNIPSLLEQQRIVAKLDVVFPEIDKSIKFTEKKIIEIEKLEDAKKFSLFNNLTSSTKDLEKVANITNGFAFKSSDFQKSSGIPVIKISNVGLKKFIKTEDINLPVNFLKKYPEFIVREGDIVFALTRSIINGGLKIAKVPKIYDKALLNQRVASITANKNLMNVDFLYHFLSSSVIKDYVLKNANTLMQPNLSISNLKKIQIPNITIKQQNKYVKVLNKISHEFVNLKSLQIKKLQELKYLKLSFINQEFQNKKAA